MGAWARRPAALVLGMDVLRQFQQVSIDFRTRRLRVVPAPRSEAAERLRLAGS